MKVDMTITHSAEETTQMVVPILDRKVNPDERFGTLVDASVKDLGGLSMATRLQYDTEAKDPA